MAFWRFVPKGPAVIPTFLCKTDNSAKTVDISP